MSSTPNPTYPAEDDDPELDEILRMRPGKERNERLREWAAKAKDVCTEHGVNINNAHHRAKYHLKDV